MLQFKPGTIQQTEKPPSLSTASIPVFTEGQNDAKSMQKIFGQLSTGGINASMSPSAGPTDASDSGKALAPLRQSGSNNSATQKSLIPNPSVQSEFDVDTDYPHIACVEGGLAWVMTEEKTLQLVDRKGSVKDTINTDFAFTDMTVTEDGDILLSDCNNKCIKSVSQQKKITTLFSTSLEPWGFCCLHNGDIVVTFPDDKVAVYSRDGQIQQTFHHIKLSWPWGVAVNKVNQDIYICDLEEWGRDTPGKLLAVGADGRLRYEYTGQHDSEFTPVDVCTDLMGHVLVADYINHRVHILDQEGWFIQYILTEQQGLRWPTFIDVDREGYVWVGGRHSDEDDTSCVKVSRYLC